MTPPTGGDGTLVQLDQVSFAYAADPVLHEVTLAVRPGEFTGIVGPSGSGKTTLLRLLLGTVRPSQGRIDRAAGTAVSYVPQLETVNWNFPVTVAECVLMARPQARLVPWASRAERAEVATLLDRLGIGTLGGRHIRELSGGQQQRMFIARALLRQPQLLLLDEPTSGVDVRTRHELLELLAELHRDGLAVVLTTHDLNGIAARLPNLVALHTRVVAAGSPAQVITPVVLEETFGARMEVYQHDGLPVVIDHYQPLRPTPVERVS
jgi:ABC-type Mn2+/Zn2+ transport system ATPase subunit